jgi:hypothetical protein
MTYEFMKVVKTTLLKFIANGRPESYRHNLHTVECAKYGSTVSSSAAARRNL